MPRYALTIAKLLILALVLLGIWQAVHQARAEWLSISDQAVEPFSWSQFGWSWYAAGAGCFVAAQIPTACFWREILRRFGLLCRPFPAFRAFYVGHLGKYVPSKLLVVAIRAGLVSDTKVDLQVASGSVFIETFTTMAAGATLSTLLIFFVLGSEGHLRWVALGVAITCLVLSYPPLIRWVCRTLGLERWSPALAESLRTLDAPLVAFGWGWALLSWTGMGLSLWCVIQSLPYKMPSIPFTESFPICVATTGLSVAAGFLSLLPGGVLAREWVMVQLLAPTYGPFLALLIPVAIRINWLLAELLGSGMLLGLRRRSPVTPSLDKGSAVPL